MRLIFAVLAMSICILGAEAHPIHPRWSKGAIQSLVDRYAEQFNIDLDRWTTLIELESSWDQFAVSPKKATGICQIWPPTARDYGLKGSRKEIIAQLKNPGTNIQICARILRDLLDRYDGNWFNVAVAFNAGPGVVTYAQKISRPRLAKQ